MPPPDVDIHPVATGSAKEIVDKHQKEENLKLYAGWFCPFVQRTWTVLEEKGVPYQYIEVNPYKKQDFFLRLNPRGLVPTLEYNGKPLYESTVIGEFIEDAFPDHKPTLLPHDPYQRARTRMWTDYCTSRIIPAYHRLLQTQDTGKEREELRSEFLSHLKEFTKEMNPQGPFFNGGEIGLIDLVVAPWAVRLFVFDEFKGGLDIPKPGSGGEDDAVWARWQKWVEAVRERPSVKNTTSERQYYLPIYKRYADDQAQSELAKATRKGRGVP